MLATAKATSVDGVADAGIAASGKGKVECVTDVVGDHGCREAPDKEGEDPPLPALEEDQEEEEGQRGRQVELENHASTPFVYPIYASARSENAIAANAPAAFTAHGGSGRVDRSEFSICARAKAMVPPSKAG